jgi:peptidyl-prolyl cis-trans isomerase C
MKSSLLFSAVLCSAVSFAQGTSSPASTPQAPSSTNQLKIRGPEAVAQQDPNRVVATINGKQITAKEAAGMLKAIPPDQLARLQTNLPTVIQQIYMFHELGDQAAKMNLDQQSPVKERIQLSRDQILTQAYLDKVGSTSSSAPVADPQQYYNSHKEEFDQSKLSGIFVAFSPPGTPASSAATTRTEQQARDKADDLEKKLKAGGDFATLARTESDNQQAAARGGDLGTHSLADPQLPPDLKTALQKLQSGQVSDPIRIPNAFLIVKVDSRKQLTFDEAKPEIIQKLQTERSQAAVKQELDKYKIQVQDPDFFNSSGASHIPSLQRPSNTTSPASPHTGAPPSKP